MRIGALATRSKRVTRSRDVARSLIVRSILTPTTRVGASGPWGSGVSLRSGRLRSSLGGRWKQRRGSGRRHGAKDGGELAQCKRTPLRTLRFPITGPAFRCHRNPHPRGSPKPRTRAQGMWAASSSLWGGASAEVGAVNVCVTQLPVFGARCGLSTAIPTCNAERALMPSRSLSLSFRVSSPCRVPAAAPMQSRHECSMTIL